jgi:aconitate hydratase
MPSLDSFGVRSRIEVDGKDYDIYRVAALPGTASLPYSTRVLLENLLRTEDGVAVSAAQIEGFLAGRENGAEAAEIQFMPARVLLQDFAGVPCVVDFAAMRDAMAELGADPDRVYPASPVELVIDHSVIVDHAGSARAMERNVDLEYRRNAERYELLRWGQSALHNLRVVPPGAGIVHQVNLEHLSQVVQVRRDGDALVALPDSCVGTDSHTTMVNGLGVLSWGVGGIEAEAAMLGQPISMVVPATVGVKVRGELALGVTSTDLVLTLAQVLRRHGVVGKVVELYGPGAGSLSLPNRATIANMSPEFGCTACFFPVDDVTLDYLRLTGRKEPHVRLVEAYSKEQGLWFDPDLEPAYDEFVEFDLGTVVPSIAGPRRPQDRIPLTEAKAESRRYLATLREGKEVRVEGADVLTDASVVIAAITSCTNTSNPSVMMAAGLLARNARRRGLLAKPWVKTSLAPGSKVVVDYYRESGLLPYMEELGFHVVGFGCTTCVGNSGPLDEAISRRIADDDLAVAAVLSGNRNFEGRVHSDVRMNYLASPPLVVAYALAGTMDIDFATDPIGADDDGRDVFLEDLWPTEAEVEGVMRTSIHRSMFIEEYGRIYEGDDHWESLRTPAGARYQWDEDSTYVRRPPFFDGVRAEPAPIAPLTGARVLALLGDSITTDHISPVGTIRAASPAGRYLEAHGVSSTDFNTYGSRRGNHEVMVRGAFSNAHLRNLLLDEVRGGFTRDFTTPRGEESTIFEAAERYAADGVSLVVLAGKEYGTGSSRDWAAKATRMLGVRAVLAESFERIHRSNLVGMGVLPLEFLDGASATALGLDGTERISVPGIEAFADSGIPRVLRVTAEPTGHSAPGRGPVGFDVRVRLDTEIEASYYLNGGILPYMLRRMLGDA